jgi:hypothetical protein
MGGNSVGYVPFSGQRTQLSREQAIEHYVLLRLRVEDIKRLSFLIEGLFDKTIQLRTEGAFSAADLKDTVRTAFFGWLATLTDKDERAVYAFDPLLALFPANHAHIIKVQMECEACHSRLQQFRNNVAFHNRSELAAHIAARRALTQEDTFIDLELARKDFFRLMNELISEELAAIPELPKVLADLHVCHHPAFANVALSEKQQVQ